MTEVADVAALRERVRALEVEVEREKRGALALRASLRADTEQSDERFRLLVEGVTDYAIFMLDTGGHVTTWNSGAERLKGYTRPLRRHPGYRPST